jgi:hypothetical protein
VISSVVAGNVQYPAGVADAVSRKLAATQQSAAAGHGDRDRAEGAHHIPVGPMAAPIAGTFPTVPVSEGAVR